MRRDGVQRVLDGGVSHGGQGLCRCVDVKVSRGVGGGERRRGRVKGWCKGYGGCLPVAMSMKLMEGVGAFHTPRPMHHHHVHLPSGACNYGKVPNEQSSHELQHRVTVT